MRLFARLGNLVRGIAAQWLNRRERRNPEAVYEAAIQERLEQYGKLREAAAGVLYMRSKLSREVEIRTRELAQLKRELDVAVERDDDDVALVLIERRNHLTEDVERSSKDLHELTEEADAAKKNLVAFHGDIAHLREEKVRMIARMQNARARLRLQETLKQLSPDADIQALEAVREHVSRLVEEARLSREIGDGDLERRLGIIRDAEARAAARSQLDELKRSRRGPLLPMVLQPPAEAEVVTAR